jgi:hypothetical protein
MTQSIARTTCLENELCGFLEVLASARDRRCLMRFLGWDGSGGCSLQAIGREYGVSRERVRQICEPGLNKLRDGREAPVLDAAIAFVEEHANRSASEVQEALRLGGFTQSTFRIEGIVKTAQLFKRAPRFELHRIGTELFITIGTDVTAAILAAAQRKVTRWGALTIADLRDEICEGSGAGVDEAFVRQVVQTRSDFQWLSEADGWFWLAACPRNRLVNRLEKVLCVAPRIGVGELHEAIARDRTMRTIAIPRDVLLALCAQVPWCRVMGDCIEAASCLDELEVLGEGERMICETLRGQGGSLPVGILERIFIDAGFTRANFWRILSDSPVIRKDVRGTYRLIGSGVRG